ncbi:hypothetical protein TRVL_07751 [Trypanosoma vivax]|nr:hypothetical protein TRVL_07751 [Trypanosoma vivax]
MHGLATIPPRQLQLSSRPIEVARLMLRREQVAMLMHSSRRVVVWEETAAIINLNILSASSGGDAGLQCPTYGASSKNGSMGVVKVLIRLCTFQYYHRHRIVTYMLSALVHRADL